MTVRLIDGEKPYTAGDGIDISTDKVISVLLREENNLIHLNSNNELYTDLQIVAGAKPTDDFEVGVTTGRVLESDGRPKTGTLLHYETTSGDYCQWLYGADTNLYFDGGDGNRRQVYYADQANEIFMRWMDFYFNTPTGNNITLDLSTDYTPTGDFTINAPEEIKDGQTYILRVNNGDTAYTMTLGTNIDNIQGTDLSLTPNATDMFVFLAVGGKLELQKEINTSSGGGVYCFCLYDETSQTELDKLWSRWDSLPEEAFDDSVIMIDSGNANAGGTYFFNTQDSQDAYFFGATNMLRIQFKMEGWYTRTGIISVTIEPLYTAGTGISITGNEISSTVEPTVVSGDTGTTYTIKVAHSAPSGVANNVITFVTPLLEYSKLIALNNADAILRELNTDALGYFQKFLDEGLIGEQLGPGDTSEETTIIYYYLMNSSEGGMKVIDGKGFIREDGAEVWNFIDYN